VSDMSLALLYMLLKLYCTVGSLAVKIQLMSVGLVWLLGTKSELTLFALGLE